MVGWNLYYFLLRFFFLNLSFTTVLLSLKSISVFNFLWRKKRNFHGRFWYLEWPDSHFCTMDKTWACLHVWVRTKLILPSLTGSCKPDLQQNLENMPSHCSLTWCCDYRGWVVKCLMINQSSGIGKENTLWCLGQIDGKGRKRRLADEGVGNVVEKRASHSWFHFKRTSSSCCRRSGNVQSWSLSLSLARPLPPSPKRFPDPWCSDCELWSHCPLSAARWSQQKPWHAALLVFHRAEGHCPSGTARARFFSIWLPLALQLFCFRKSTFPSMGL